MHYHYNNVGAQSPNLVNVITINFNDWLKSLGHELNTFEQSFFYSDSINDLPLLEVVTHPVVTNPSPSLRDVAVERQWPILDIFGKPLDQKS